MKLKKEFWIFLDILYFVLLCIFLHFAFSFILNMDLIISSNYTFNMPNMSRESIKALKILGLRRILLVPCSFFSCCVLDFNFIKKILKKFKAEKYSKFVFCSLVFITVVVYIIVKMFRVKYRL